LAIRLTREGHRVRVVIPFEGPLRARLEEGGVEVEMMEGLPLLKRAALKNPLRLLKLLVDIPRYARRIQRSIHEVEAEVVHTNTATVLFSPALAARRARLPHIWHMRENFSEFGPVWPVFRRGVLAFSHRILCISHSVREQFGPSEKVEVLHNGYMREEFEGVEPEQVEAFRRTHAEGDGFLVGIVGRIKWVRKGQEVFVRAAARLKERYPTARFLLIGSPFPGNESHLEKLLALVKDLGLDRQVVYLGTIDDVRTAMSALDVSVMASVMAEPFGGVVIESMALGTPVVASANGGPAEIVEDGVSGLLFPPGDDAAMAEAIDRLLRDEVGRKQMAEAARRRFEEAFEYDRFYESMVKVYKELIDG
ncbi:MAG: glycosyltransferase family 4 protein, partial [Verrucomicrobiota bacterium]